MEFRYSAVARDLEEALAEDLKPEPKTAEVSQQESGLERIAKSAGDELDALVDGYGEIKQHETRKKLAAISRRDQDAAEEFLRGVK